MHEPYNDVGDLHSRIINIVLDLDPLVGSRKDPDKRVTENRISDMPNMCGFVGIYAGVLYHPLRSGWGNRFGGIPSG
jgi:hypothetical protein